MPPHSPAYALSIRVDLAGGGRVGPGKISLLDAIDTSGSISAAGRAMGMSYRRAWKLVEDLNRVVGIPLVEAAAGGAGGGGARLTEAGRALVREYRAMQQAATEAAGAHLRVLGQAAGEKPGLS